MFGWAGFLSPAPFLASESTEEGEALSVFASLLSLGSPILGLAGFSAGPSGFEAATSRASPPEPNAEGAGSE